MITLINGNIQNPSGLVVPNGSMSLQLNIDATVIASPFGIIPGDLVIVFQFDKNGNILPNAPATAAQIYSNLELNPQNSIGLGTYYLVTFYDANRARINKSPMWWQFTEVASSTVDISQMTPFASIGGNVIFYPVSFAIAPPTPTALGGIFSNAGGPHLFVSAINTNGSVTLTQPSFADISGMLSNAQLPNPLIFTTVTASGLITAQAGLEVGVIGTTSGQIALDGSTSGQAFITAPAIAGIAANPVSFSNGINIPAGTAYSINFDTGISRDAAGILDVGNGTPGNTSGTVNAAAYQVGGVALAASNLSNGTQGTGQVVLGNSPTIQTPTLVSPVGISGPNPGIIFNATEIGASLWRIGEDVGFLDFTVGGSSLAASIGPTRGFNIGNSQTDLGFGSLHVDNLIVAVTSVSSPIFQSGSGVGGPTWTSGAGVPSLTPPAVGSMYSNTSGGVGTSFYVWNGSAWIAVA